VLIWTHWRISAIDVASVLVGADVFGSFVVATIRSS